MIEEQIDSRNAVSPIVNNMDPNALNVIAEESHSQSHYTGIKSPMSGFKPTPNLGENPKQLESEFAKKAEEEFGYQQPSSKKRSRAQFELEN